LLNSLSTLRGPFHKSSKYAPILKNSVEYIETLNERIFLMKDLVAVEEALSLSVEIYEGDIQF